MIAPPPSPILRQQRRRASARPRTVALVLLVVAASLVMPNAGAADVSTRAWLAQSGDFEVFLQLTQAAGVENTLERGIDDNGFNDGKITTFAPTDAAFRQLGSSPDGARLLRGLDSARAREIVLFHIVPGRFATSQLAQDPGWTTLAGGELVIANGRIGTPGADASMGPTDIATSTGVIHVIDQVVIPYSLR